MRLMQFCNLANVVGGTGACCWTITRCFPDWEHGVYFRSGRSPSPDTMLAFQGCSIYLNHTTPEEAIEQFKPDVLIFHNISETVVPQALPAGVPTIFYQHSALKQFRVFRERFDVAFCVSKHLAAMAGFDERFVLYQPVPIPPMGGVRDCRKIGRICTPNSGKWDKDDILPVYEHLGPRFPQLAYEFVGCPPNVREELEKILGDRASFANASFQARQKFHEWGMMVYSSKIEESYGRTVCEAQRAGCVPIVSRRGGFIEQVAQSPVDGFLCDSPEEFGDAVQAVLNEPPDRNLMAARATERGGLAGFRDAILTTLEALTGVGHGSF
jgi:glycosyltransferase involved in cell wall biosynthesis